MWCYEKDLYDNVILNSGAYLCGHSPLSRGLLSKQNGIVDRKEEITAGNITVIESSSNLQFLIHLGCRRQDNKYHTRACTQLFYQFLMWHLKRNTMIILYANRRTLIFWGWKKINHNKLQVHWKMKNTCTLWLSVYVLSPSILHRHYGLNVVWMTKSLLPCQLFRRTNKCEMHFSQYFTLNIGQV